MRLAASSELSRGEKGRVRRFTPHRRLSQPWNGNLNRTCRVRVSQGQHHHLARHRRRLSTSSTLSRTIAAAAAAIGDNCRQTRRQQLQQHLNNLVATSARWYATSVGASSTTVNFGPCDTPADTRHSFSQPVEEWLESSCTYDLMFMSFSWYMWIVDIANPTCITSWQTRLPKWTRPVSAEAWPEITSARAVFEKSG
ncbi:hypothetical protein M3J09_007178 [Ascochyta lentis]